MELKKGEVICSECNGQKDIENPHEIPKEKRKPYKVYITRIVCPKCKGEGKLDWIENLIGKEKTVTTASLEIDIEGTVGSDLTNSIYADMTKEIAYDIDDKIINNLLGKNNK